MILQTKQQKGLAVVAELFSQVARLHDKNIMRFFQKTDYVRPSQILETVTELAGSKLSTVLGMALKWRLVKKVGHLYSLDKDLLRTLSNYLDTIGFDRYESEFATWHKAARGIAPIASVQGWIALAVLAKGDAQLRVNDVTEGINDAIRAEQIFRRSGLGKPELMLIQQPATTQLLKRFVSLGLVGTEKDGQRRMHFICDQQRLFFLASLGEQYAAWETVSKPSKKKISEEILII